MIKIENELKKYTTNKQHNLYDLSQQSPVLLVLLRHTGCIFCRENLQDVSKVKENLSEKGIKIVLVNLSDIESGSKIFKQHGLDDLEVIQDEERNLYKLFQLNEFQVSQLFNYKIFTRGLEAMLNKNFQSKPTGESKQLSGMFLIHKNKIIKSFYQKLPSDRPDYAEFEACDIS